MRVNLLTALSVSIPIGVICVFLMTIVLRARKNRVSTGSEGMVGEIGVGRPDGKVFVHGELWNAANPVEPGKRVRVRAVDGLRVVVEPVET